jgi:hypothetical protein
VVEAVEVEVVVEEVVAVVAAVVAVEVEAWQLQQSGPNQLPLQEMA